MSDTTSLLPPNATTPERALSSCTARTTALAVGPKYRSLWSPETCPAAILPWLAWALHVDEWDADWTEEQKRQVIADSVATHKTKGTIGALKRALDSLGYEVTVDENTGDVFTFRIAVNLNQTGPITGDQFLALKRVALANKNARSHLSSIKSEMSYTAGVYVGIAQCRAQTVTVIVPPFIFETQEWDGTQDDDLDTVNIERTMDIDLGLTFIGGSEETATVADPQTETIDLGLTFIGGVE